MQLNVYIPKEKEPVVRALDKVSQRLGKQKNDLVIEAIEAYLERTKPTLGSFDLGETLFPERDSLYLERWSK